MDKNIKIIGTSHVSKKSAKEVENAVEEWKPDIIAVELDKNRMKTLLSNKKRKLPSIRKIGVTTYVFLKLASVVQKKVGKKLGVTPGAEMKTAIQLARKNKIPLALIDQDIGVTAKKISKYFTFREKLKFIRDIFFFKKIKKEERAEMKKLVTGDVPEEKSLEKLLKIFQTHYPGIYKILVEERNIIMGNRLIKLQQDFPEKKILAIVGAGHKKEMEKILEKPKGLKT